MASFHGDAIKFGGDVLKIAAAREAAKTPTPLTKDEIAKCALAFELYDKDGNKSIDLYELREALRAVGQNPTEKELASMIAEVDQNGNQVIEYCEFLDLIARYKEPTISRPVEGDIVDAFVAMGGRPDRTGEVSTHKLSEYFSMFGLSVDIDKLVADIDKDQSGYVDFDEFRALLGAAQL